MDGMSCMAQDLRMGAETTTVNNNNKKLAGDVGGSRQPVDCSPE